MVAVSDGSYKDNVAAAAFTIAKKGQKNVLISGKAKVPSPGNSASPYRAEIFGFLAMMAWIEAVVDANQIRSGTITCGFDNESGTKRLTELVPACPEQADWDLIQVARNALEQSKLHWNIFWVRGHQDDTGKTLSQEEWLNVESDRLAKECWTEMEAEANPPHTEVFQGEQVSLFVHGQKQTTFEGYTIYHKLIERGVKNYWIGRHEIDPVQADNISWSTLDGAVKQLPREIRRWSSKHFAGFSATGRVMQRRGDWDHSNCPACQQMEENAEHLWYCPSQLIQDKWTECNEAFQTHLDKIVTAPAICAVMRLLFPPTMGIKVEPAQVTIAEWKLIEAQRDIGIDNLFRGRLAHYWIDYQERWLRARATKWKRSVKRWAHRFVAYVLCTNWEVWRVWTDFLHSEKHPRTEADWLETIQQFRKLAKDTSQFLRRDLPAIQKTLTRCEQLSVEEARRAVESLQVAQQRKINHTHSLQGPRSVMHRWLQSGNKTNT